MIVFILMSGIFTPFESMPQWAQDFDRINPVAHLIKINRMVMLKGSSIQDISHEIYSIVAIAIVFTTLAVWRYRKTA
jgi:ABC-2 type transport system permease protein